LWLFPDRSSLLSSTRSEEFGDVIFYFLFVRLALDYFLRRWAIVRKEHDVYLLGAFLLFFLLLGEGDLLPSHTFLHFPFLPRSPNP